ncbi:hypothetical protein B7L13_08500 [Klebsiella oxytoca]|uniref:hypothetical protein n=1 Tax=Klebsiella oxytoca TaxID=571 RepID=UPI000F8C5B51|nr:hypothetical protein [Klebsiella oxytoca]HBZ0718537.1 hypothetical protein [Klebsiella pneumoniae]EKT8243932.1 hypothetical protein [Klebsiella oxytoca]MCW1903840.1 hypothetical protein [Klebsiella oxytoca]RUS54946.1 hypothetical protein B7L13_08500 [Klebsiella oxytoca]HBU6149845.1 hypothetical protein [Klebsiella oxytoca]
MENAVLGAVGPTLNVLLDALKEEKGAANVEDVKAVIQVISEVVGKCDGDLATGYAVWDELLNAVLRHISTKG